MIIDGYKGVVNYADGKLRYIDEGACFVEFSHLSYPGKVGERALPLGPRFVQIDLQESTLFDTIPADFNRRGDVSVITLSLGVDDRALGRVQHPYKATGSPWAMLTET